MEVKKINTDILIEINENIRPDSFDSFVGQEQIKKVLKTAIGSAKERQSNMGHVLFCGPSGFGKTTMAHIISKQSNVNMKAVTGYAISKPSEIVSILNNLEEGDILFIDEIHRLKPSVEEVLYIAMEDYVIDMVMPEGGNVRIPLNKFTLIGATTKGESLSKPIKNRFIYDFHFMEYNAEEKKKIIKKYLDKYNIPTENSVIEKIHHKVDSVPREIHNLCIKIRDFFVTEGKKAGEFSHNMRNEFLNHSSIDEGGMSPIHQKYLDVLKKNDRPMGLKSISIQLGMNEKGVEEDIEPLLLKLGKIEKSSKGRILI
ncbi:MAG TPA: Holliday junction branch migration DNA helicase RuvB [Candidatus Absconditabacterales bacterium]|nr:Holliday junction branch migration DNA helicase RuvB [Candidatus Absconditabacterales bacterium]